MEIRKNEVENLVEVELLEVGRLLRPRESHHPHHHRLHRPSKSFTMGPPGALHSRFPEMCNPSVEGILVKASIPTTTWMSTGQQNGRVGKDAGCAKRCHLLSVMRES